MCGRAAQTRHAVRAAAESLQNELSSSSNSFPAVVVDNNPELESNNNNNETEEESSSNNNDNYNMSPGMDAYVFWYDENSKKIKINKKTWGLVTKPGNKSNPIEDGIGKHFQNFMFNARSDTLYDKPTFARLANTKKTCLIAFDGFFEWKSELKGKKQPYFVYRNNKNSSNNYKGSNNNDENSKSNSILNNDDNNNEKPYLLFAGLWTSVPTGLDDENENEILLDTFTIITTEVCKSLEWLHTRMPVTIWDENLALQWLINPSISIHKQLSYIATNNTTKTNTTTTTTKSLNDDNDNELLLLQWHPVTPDMSSMKYRTIKAIQPLPKLKTVKSFFTTKASTTTTSSTTVNENDNISPVVIVKKTENTVDNNNNNSTTKSQLKTTSSDSGLAGTNKRTFSKIANNNTTRIKTPEKKKPNNNKGKIDSFFKRK